MDVDKIIRKARRRPIFEDSDTTQEVDLGLTAIKRLLPHRDPFLFVDRVTHVDLVQQAARGQRRIDPHDPVFDGHFPDYKVYPGALLVETMGQLAICLHHLLTWGRVTVHEDDVPPPVRLLRVHHAVFLGEVLPGDELTLLNRLVEADSYTMICASQALKQGSPVTAAVMEVYLPEAE